MRLFKKKNSKPKEVDFGGLEHHYILRALRFAVPKDRFARDEMTEGCNITLTELNRLAQNKYLRQEGSEYTVHPDAFFNYLEYVELKEALKSSRIATRIAISSIIISGILALASLLK